MAEDQTIKSSYRFTLDELIMARSVHEKLTLRRKRWAALLGTFWSRVLMSLIGVAALSRLVLDVIQRNQFSALHALNVLLTVLAVGFLALPWISRRSLKRHFEKRPDRDRIVRYTIDAQGVMSSIEGFSEGSSEWSSFAEVVRMPQGFLFYPHDMMFYWLPNHAFASPEDADALADIARQHAPKYKDLGQ